MSETIPVQKLEGRVTGLFAALAGPYATPDTSFVSSGVDSLTLGYDGIPGDVHSGITRPSGSREPWYPRGTEIRNERQISILSIEELADIAAALSIPELMPEWIGANIVIEGIPQLTALPPRTQLFFEGGATIRIDGDNGPCKIAGGSIAGHFDGRGDIELGFVQAARGRRGLVGWVEKPGVIGTGSLVTARTWPQKIYRAGNFHSNLGSS
jgi:hypothetical protein